MDKLTLTRMEFYGYHGVFSEETKLGQRFYVDTELMLSLDKAGSTDHIDDTVNYAEAFFLIQKIVEGRTFKLIEALAACIASELLHTYTSINEVTVRVIKPHPPFNVHFEGVTVEINRKRAE